jgi:hypothetical protein
VPFAALALLLVLVLPLVAMAAMPLILIQRYRAGSVRRIARPWLAKLNVVAMVVSAAFFLTAAAFTNIWVARTLEAAAAGMTIGLGLGVLGLWLSRWESTPRSLHYTPNRWLVFAITFVVAARVLYGLARSIAALASGQESLITAFGLAGSLAAGAIVVGYYLAYAVGLWYHVRRWEQRPVRVLN